MSMFSESRRAAATEESAIGGGCCSRDDEQRLAIEAQLAGLDPEERALSCREWCCLRYWDGAGLGPEATLNRAIIANDEELANAPAAYGQADIAAEPLAADQKRDRELHQLMRQLGTNILEIQMTDEGEFDFSLFPRAADRKRTCELHRLMQKHRTNILEIEMSDQGRFDFTVRKRRLAMLKGSEAILLFETASFLMWRYGVWFNLSVTIVPKLMGLSAERFVELMPQWNKAVKKWLAVSVEKTPKRNGEERQRRPRRPMSTKGQPHYWMYVYEYGRDAGLHVHELCVVPKELRDGFEKHTRNWWARAAKHLIPNEAINFRRSYAKHSNAGLETFHRVRYMLGSMDRTVTVMREGHEHQLEAIFKLDPSHAHAPSLIPVAQIYGRCHELSELEQHQREGCLERFVSKIETGEFDQLASGWELQDLISARSRSRFYSDRIISNLGEHRRRLSCPKEQGFAGWRRSQLRIMTRTLEPHRRLTAGLEVQPCHG